VLEFSLEQFWKTVVTSLAIFIAVVGVVRINGLRTFSKMASFDFAVTVAVGSLLASIALTPSNLLSGIVALGTIVAAQRVVSILRRRFRFERLVDNTPVLLMADGVVIEEHMSRTRVTPTDLRAKLREANVLDLSEVRAVVLETTGDISVLHGERLAPSLLDGVEGADRLQ
jgi:uncharacterized membrane protein YcaP (DUF421 family)